MKCKISQSPLISYRSLLYSTTVLYDELGNKPNYSTHEFTRVIYKFIPTFEKLMDLASYQVKRMDKLVNHSFQLVCSLACFQVFMQLISSYFLIKFFFTIVHGEQVLMSYHLKTRHCVSTHVSKLKHC